MRIFLTIVAAFNIAIAFAGDFDAASWRNIAVAVILVAILIATAEFAP